MTISQLKGMLRFHKAAYKAYQASGQTENAAKARLKIVETYLLLRKARS
jgi:hypothetical protein